MEKIPLSKIKAFNGVHGGYWFSPSSTRFFHSRYPRFAYKAGGEAYFVTSEQFDYKSERLYTIRVCNLLTGGIETLGDFQQYSSGKEAIKAMMRIIR